jgi:hypothetical protein
LITIDLPFPPATRETTVTGEQSLAHHTWREQAAEAIAEQRPRCAPGPVEICVTLEYRGEFRAIGNLTANVLDVLVRGQIITGSHAQIVQRITLQWAKAQRGARVEISSAMARAA